MEMWYKCCFQKKKVYNVSLEVKTISLILKEITGLVSRLFLPESIDPGVLQLENR